MGFCATAASSRSIGGVTRSGDSRRPDPGGRCRRHRLLPQVLASRSSEGRRLTHLDWQKRSTAGERSRMDARSGCARRSLSEHAPGYRRHGLGGLPGPRWSPRSPDPHRDNRELGRRCKGSAAFVPSESRRPMSNVRGYRSVHLHVTSVCRRLAMPAKALSIDADDVSTFGSARCSR